MLAIPVVLTILAGVIAAAWISRHFQIGQEKRDQSVLHAGCPGPPEDAPKITVVIAAKDEAGNIEQCLRTMLDQDYPHFEVIVCNDRSTDDTGAIVERMAASDTRLRLINIQSLPEGWCGKSHAMQKGIAASSGPWICMIDADCRQTSNRTLSTAVQHAVDNQIDLLSVLPTLEMHGLWEVAVQPVCSGMLMIWYDPADVNNPDKPQAYANGAFMLIRRSTYEAIGTHEAIRGELVEDMNMAARVKQSGHKLKVIRNSGLYQVRMYSSLTEMVRGWCRIFFGSFATIGRLALGLVALMLVGMGPWVITPVAFALAATTEGMSGWWLACGITAATALVLELSVLVRFYRFCDLRGRTVWTYPFGNVVATYAMVFALTRHLPNTKVVWRDTEYTRR